MLYLLFSFLSFASQGQKNDIDRPIAFPGAEGFGKYATGGRGGKVAAVTNLNDDGEGSFRNALEKFPGEPLTVIFKVSVVLLN